MGALLIVRTMPKDTATANTVLCHLISVEKIGVGEIFSYLMLVGALVSSCQLSLICHTPPVYGVHHNCTLTDTHSQRCLIYLRQGKEANLPPRLAHRVTRHCLLISTHIRAEGDVCRLSRHVDPAGGDVERGYSASTRKESRLCHAPGSLP